MGRALKSLRNKLVPKVTQEAAAERAGVTLTTWQNYEMGKRRFGDALIANVTHALGASPDELVAERDRLEAADRAIHDLSLGAFPMRVMEFPLRGRVQPTARGVEVFDDVAEDGAVDMGSVLGRAVRFMRVAGECMSPYVEPGGWVAYDTAGYPRRGEGCVIIDKGGRAFIKRFERTAGSELHVSEIFPEERAMVFDLAEVKGVYPVILRSN